MEIDQSYIPIRQIEKFMNNEILNDLLQAYDRAADERSKKKREDWKLVELQKYLSHLQAEKIDNLLEIGSGTGFDSEFFRDNGLNVISSDLSHENARYCYQKGLNACQMDYFNLALASGFGGTLWTVLMLLSKEKP